MINPETLSPLETCKIKYRRSVNIHFSWVILLMDYEIQMIMEIQKGPWHIGPP